MHRNEVALSAKDSGFHDFLDRDSPRSRYIVIAVDPAGGGKLSEEAFVVFLVSSNRMVLLGGRVVTGARMGSKFNTIPLRFVLALLQTIKDVKLELPRLFPSRSSANPHFG